jgi:hypothetical protein
MLQAHSFIWHYLWLAPHVLQLGLGILMWRRGLHRLFPLFWAYLMFEAVEEFALYVLDVSPRFSAHTFWSGFCIGLVVQGLISFAVIGELFRHTLGLWPALAKVGNRLISGIGAILVVLATLAAAYAPIDNPQFSIVSRAHILEQTFYIIQCGLILFLFLFAAHFELTWDRHAFGIAFGFAIVWCEHMATWAVMASGALLSQRHLLDLLNMATYQVCVLIWCYYLLVPQKIVTTSAAPLPEHNLDIWNRELERLLQ